MRWSRYTRRELTTSVARALWQAACILALPGLAIANLVQNPGFEAGAKGWELPEGFTLDNAVAHRGAASLRFGWNDPAQRRLATQRLPLRPGRRYLISAWLKSDNVHGAALGATFGAQWWRGEDCLGGSSPLGVGWTTDWTEVRFVTDVVTPGTLWAEVYATLDWNGVGRAWIDDVSVTELPVAEVLRWRLLTPRVVGAEDSPPFRVSVDLARGDLLGDGVDVAVEVCTPPWNAALPGQGQAVPATGAHTFEFPTGALLEGVYRFRALLRDHQTGRDLMAPGVLQTAVKRPPVECLLEPHSEVTAPGQPTPRLRVRPYRNGALAVTVRGADGAPVGESPPQRLRAGVDREMLLPVLTLPPGRYQVEARLTAVTCPEYTGTLDWTVLSPAQAARGTLIGPDNLLRDRGRAWLPMFVYAATALAPQTMAPQQRRDPAYVDYVLDHLAGTPLGLLDYSSLDGGPEALEAYAEECTRRGVRFIPAVNLYETPWAKPLEHHFPGFTSREQAFREVARRLRDCPSLAGYYINDELCTEYFGAMREMRRWLHQEDPLHPTIQVHVDLTCTRELAPSYDIFGFELYPWRDWDAMMLEMPEMCDTVLRDLPPTAPFWACLWHFSNAPDGSERLRALTYLALAKGARGLLFYAFHEFQRDAHFQRRWLDLIALSREIEAQAPILTGPEADRPCRTSTPGVVLRTFAGDPGWLLVVNPVSTAKAAAISVPPGTTRARWQRHDLAVHDGTLTLCLRPYDVRLLRLERGNGNAAL